MTDKAPKIEFPCPDYPIKVMGDAGESLHQCVVEVMAFHAPDFDTAQIRVRDSRQGRYQSLTVRITAQGEEQLKNIHQDLMASPAVKMVL